MARRRSALRLLCELLLVGVHHNTLPLVATVRTLAAADFERDTAGAHAALSLLAGFARWHRVEFLGFPRRPPTADLPPDTLTPVTVLSTSDDSPCKGEAFSESNLLSNIATFTAGIAPRMPFASLVHSNRSASPQKDVCMESIKTCMAMGKTCDVVNLQLQEGDEESEELCAARAELAQQQAAYEEEVKLAFLPSEDSQELFLAALTRAYDKACEALLCEHAALARTEHDNARVLNNRCGLLLDPLIKHPMVSCSLLLVQPTQSTRHFCIWRILACHQQLQIAVDGYVASNSSSFLLSAVGITVFPALQFSFQSRSCCMVKAGMRKSETHHGA